MPRSILRTPLTLISHYLTPRSATPRACVTHLSIHLYIYIYLSIPSPPQVRSAASMCYVALLAKAVGHRNKGRGSSTVQSVTGGEFFLRNRTLHPSLLTKLAEAVAQLGGEGEATVGVTDGDESAKQEGGAEGAKQGVINAGAISSNSGRTENGSGDAQRGGGGGVGDFGTQGPPQSVSETETGAPSHASLHPGRPSTLVCIPCWCCWPGCSRRSGPGTGGGRRPPRSWGWWRVSGVGGVVMDES